MKKSAPGNTPQSPRALATREKNREAVRKCRQRKRERAEELKVRCEELSKENVRLRMHLELGNEEAHLEKLAKGRMLLEEMEKILQNFEPGKLSSKERTPAKIQLESVYNLFLERHLELGPDRLSALSFLTKRLHSLIESDAMTKAYLFILTLPEEETGWWKHFCHALDLSEEQQRQIKLRSLFGHRLRAELFDVQQRADSLSKSITGRKNLAMSFVELMRAFTSAQLAKFVLWVNTDACGNELLDLLWSELIENVDQTLNKEDQLIGPGPLEIGALEVQRLLNLVRQENGELFRTLFENKDIRDSERISKRIFHQHVVLIDPANGGTFSGLEQVLKYVDKMRRAFKELKFDQIAPLEFSSGDKAMGKYQLKGIYHGNLTSHQRLVSVECVVSITFCQDSAKIVELVVSNDLMGLFQSLSQPSLSSSLDHSVVDGLQHEAERAISLNRAKLIGSLKDWFESDAPVVDVSSFVDHRCVFVDSNMSGTHRGEEACLAYVRRIRSAFPKWKVVKEKIEQEVDGLKESFKIEWEVEAAYGGKLSVHNKPCILHGLLFLTTDDEGKVITNLAMSWNAKSLFRELGVNLKDDETG